ncbi:MAG: site-specific DNA-methyltransferase [Deltaproteobacteria bacterium]|nr:site-specific DNA-methyltransferase [Deltaproteobacteria bacterium]
MTTDNDISLPLTTPDLTQELLAQLRESVPHVFSEEGIDFEKLKSTLGGNVDSGVERYGLNWAGKSEAFRMVQSPSVGTLLPMREESVDWDTTGNQIIEGDNLEVLKLLQKSYHGAVKLIYIDPPYNTGNEFIYPDNFREGLQDYLKYSKQIDDEGNKQSTNSETSGRYHSNWLSMMYPRLFLARNLLKEDGVIFVSIDDHEVHNLRLLMEEIFGEENFIAQFVRKKRMPTGMRDTEVSPDHEYIVTFARSIQKVELIGRSLQKEDYPFSDIDGEYRSTDLTIGMTKAMRPNQYYAAINPETGMEYWPSEQRVWRFEPSTMRREIKSKNIIWPEDIINSRMTRPRYKTRFEPNKTSPISTWIGTNKNDSEGSDVKQLIAGMNQEGTRQLRSLFGNQALEYPKPVSLLTALVSSATSSSDIVLDFFAGSGTTAQAVLELNKGDNGDRKFILVQLPEKTDNEEYPTIAHITRERVRRVIKKLKTEESGTLDFKNTYDQGFRAFKLEKSNFKIWDVSQAPSEPDALAAQLSLYANNIERLLDHEDILFELLLKSGLSLASRIECMVIEGSPVFSVNEGQLLICLERPVSLATLRGMIEKTPAQLLCLDTAFDGNDKLKTNILLEAQSHQIVFRTV